MNGLALCSGIGGIELGLGRAITGYRTICYVEQNPYAASVLAARMGDSTLCKAPIWDDLRTFDCGPWRGIVDIISAGFPCQPVSYAGRRKGSEDERWVWPYISCIIGQVEAPLIFLENVPGIVSLGLRQVLSDLARYGYDAKWTCISAAAVGAPHERLRWFLLAYPARVLGKEILGDESDKILQEICDANSEGREKFSGSAALPEGARFGTSDRSSWWDIEPDVGRVAHGVPSRVDRLRCLGNAVVPAQAELAWRILTS